MSQAAGTSIWRPKSISQETVYSFATGCYARTHARTHTAAHTAAHTQVSNNERRPSLLPGLQGPVQGLHVAFGDLQELRVRQLGPPPQLEGGSRGSMWEGFASGAALPPHYDWVLKNGSPLTSGRC